MGCGKYVSCESSTEEVSLNKARQMQPILFMHLIKKIYHRICLDQIAYVICSTSVCCTYENIFKNIK